MTKGIALKTFLKFLFIVFFILFSSSLLAPWLFTFLPYKFERIFNRLVMIQTLAAIFIFVRIKHLDLKRYGLAFNPARLKQFFLSFGLTVSVLLSIEILRFWAGIAAWGPDSTNYLEGAFRIFLIFFAAVLIGFIEEFFFRGFIFTSLRERIPLWMSFIVTSIFYSLIHFMSRRNPFIGPHPNFMDSLKLALAPLGSFLEIGSFWQHAFGLFIFGLVLNWLFWRTQSLYPSMGFHAGGVFFIKVDGFFVDLHRDSVLWGTQEWVDGIGVWFFIVFLGWAILTALRKARLATAVAVFFFLMGAAFLPPNAFAAKEKSKKEIYSFTQHLKEAKSQILYEDNGKKRRDEPEIPLETKKENPDLISFHPVARARRALIFKNVPPGPFLKLEFELISLAEEKDQASHKKEFKSSYMDFRVYQGGHLLKSIRLSNQKGRIRQDIDLGVGAFLKDRYPFTFELSSPEESAVLFFFKAEIAAS